MGGTLSFFGIEYEDFKFDDKVDIKLYENEEKLIEFLENIFLSKYQDYLIKELIKKHDRI